MKKLYVLISLLVAATSLSAQNPTTYFMTGTPLRMQWNPAMTPDRGYFNIPGVGAIQVATAGNIAVSDIFYPTANGDLATIFSSAVPSTLALSELEEISRLGVGTSVNVIGFGGYTKKRQHFWSFDVNVRADADTQIPYEFFDFMKTGNSNQVHDLGISMDSFAEVGFAYSFPFFRNFNFGFRVKALLGLARGVMHFDELNASMGSDCWYAHATGKMEFSGVAPGMEILPDNRMVYDMEHLFDRFKFPAGYGFGLDLGFSWTIARNLKISAAVNDLGMLYWSKRASSVGSIDHDITFTGVQIDENGTSTQPEFGLDELEFNVMDGKNFSDLLRISYNVGAEYNFLNQKIGLGVFYHAKSWEYGERHNVTVAANLRPLRWLHISGSYSLMDNGSNAVGLALNLCPGFINLFVGTDILLSDKTPQWIPIDQSNMNVSFGLSIPVGKRVAR